MVDKEIRYKAFKQYLNTLNLSAVEYEKRLKEWCKKMGY